MKIQRKKEKVYIYIYIYFIALRNVQFNSNNYCAQKKEMGVNWKKISCLAKSNQYYFLLFGCSSYHLSCFSLLFFFVSIFLTFFFFFFTVTLQFVEISFDFSCGSSGKKI